MNINYREYIISDSWRSLHPIFLEKSKHRCSMFPWVKCGKRRRYNIHHMNYNNLGDEQLWKDVVVVSPFAHKWIIHGILSGFKRPRHQKVYPNKYQQAAHFWCCLPLIIKQFLTLVISAFVTFVGSLIFALCQ